MRYLQKEIERKSGDAATKAGQQSGAGAAEGVAEELLERQVLHGPPQAPSRNGVTLRRLFGAGASGAVLGAAVSVIHETPELRELQTELESVVEKLKTEFETLAQIKQRLQALEAERSRRGRG
jgi:hypothetical protein